jgi:peptide chain release factor subunit 1
MITAETIGRILRLDGDGLPVVSMYVQVPVDPQDRAALFGRANSLLDGIGPMARGKSMDRASRLSVRDDLEHLREAIRTGQWRPGSVALFSCSGRDLFEAVQLPHAVRDRVVVDDTAWARPMLAVLDEYARCCVAVVDRATARVWELFADEMQEARKLSDRTLRRPNYAANLAEDRVHNKVEELAKKHYRRTAAELAELFDTDGYDLLAVGGHRYEVPRFLDTLPRELRRRVAGTFTVDPHTVEVSEIKQNADAIVARYVRDIDIRLAGEVLEKSAAGSGLAALGVGGCLWAGTVKAVETLLVQDGAMVAGVACTNCGWLGLSGETCPLCEHPARRTGDILDELARAVIDDNGAVRHVKADTDVKEHLAAAALRFPLPPVPQAA